MQTVATGFVHIRQQDGEAADRIAAAVDRDGSGVFLFKGAKGRRQARLIAHQLGDRYEVKGFGPPSPDQMMGAEPDASQADDITTVVVHPIGVDAPVGYWVGELVQPFS